MSDKKIKSVLWDLDGTLLDSFGLYFEILNEVFSAKGIPQITKAQLRPHFHGSLHESVRSLSRESDKKVLEELVATFLIVQNRAYKEVEHNLFKDALSLGRRLKEQGMVQVIVTNREHENRGYASPRSIVQRSSLVDFIDHIVSGDDGVHRKPKPAVIERLLSEGIVQPETTLVIGDQFVDAEFAHNLGSRCILVQRTSEVIHHLDRINDNAQFRVVTSLDEVVL